MKKKKNNTKIYISLLIVFVVLLILLGYYIFFKEDNGYNYQEKKWISENSNKVIDVYVNNELPMFSYGGEGVFYEYLKDLSEETDLKFNTVNTVANYKLDLVSNLKENDIVFYTDHFIAISEDKDIKINSINDLSSKRVGILSKYANSIKYYLSSVSGINFITYETFDNIEASLNNSIDIAIVPRITMVNKIVSQNYNIIYHFSDLNVYYAISSENEDELSVIFNKFFKNWKVDLTKLIGSNLMDIYFNASNTSKIDRESLNNKDYILGYVENLPYEASVRTRFTGITDTYLDTFSELTGVTFKYNQYRNKESLENALSSNDVDLLYNYKNYSSNSYLASVELNNIEYVVLAHRNNNLVLNSIYGLKGYTVKMQKDTNLTTYLRGKDIFTINEISEAKNIVKKLSSNDIIILEREVYEFYKNKLGNFTVRYSGYVDESNDFLLYNGNKIFNNVFNFYLSFISPSEVNRKGINNTIKVVEGPIVYAFVVRNRAYFICGGIVLIYVLYRFISRKRREYKLKKEDKIIYRDKLTNLKNRNYLNDNIDLWDSNKVYPQAVIVVDLNNVAYINDTAGHEEGDRQIQAAANILIKNQRESSEIIRTDGNEFLIYLVGYEERMITTYMNRLFKEFKKLPYNYGASLGYSMITSEIKTIDDAINDALGMIKQGKDESSEKGE